MSHDRYWYSTVGVLFAHAWYRFISIRPPSFHAGICSPRMGLRTMKSMIQPQAQPVAAGVVPAARQDVPDGIDVVLRLPMRPEI